MDDLTLLIPAKHEAESLPLVLDELKKYNLPILVVLSNEDKTTIEAIKNYPCEILFQKKKGYGAALIEGISKINTKYLCIFNADGSFNPSELSNMYKMIQDNQFIFASRYMKNAGSDDDSFLTFIGNKIFSTFGQIFFSLNLTDILYTFIMGESAKFKEINLINNDFRICVEIPFNVSSQKFRYKSVPSYERKRLKGKKKVNEFKDGFLILFYMIKRFLKK